MSLHLISAGDLNFFSPECNSVIVIRPQTGTIHRYVFLNYNFRYQYQIRQIVLIQLIYIRNMAETQNNLNKIETLDGMPDPATFVHGSDHSEKHIAIGQFIKSAVYGGLDGIITTLCVALPGIGASVKASYILALGFSSLIADGLSMAIADYLATKSDAEYMKSEEERELAEINNDFEAEKREMVHIYMELGLKPQVSEQIVKILSSNKEGFLKVMMIEELQLIADQENPIRNSIVTFFSFCVFGFMPLIPTLAAKVNNLELTKDFIWITVVVSVFFLFVLGFSKSFVTGAKWYFSAIETILIGAFSAGASFGVGYGLGVSE